MEKTRDIHKELKTLRENMMRCFRKVKPAKNFADNMILAIMRLHIIDARILRTQDLNERRLLIHEFTRRRNIIKKRLRLPGWVDGQESFHTGQEHRQGMS